MVWIEEGFVLQHGAGDGEQAICNGSERSSVAVTALAESGVFGLADRIVLYGDARPMVERVAEAAVCGETSDDDLAFSGALGDRRHATQTSQSMVVSPLQGIEGLCEQRGEDDPTHSRQGCEDRYVALLRVLSRLGVCACGDVLGRLEGGSARGNRMAARPITMKFIGVVSVIRRASPAPDHAVLVYRPMAFCRCPLAAFPTQSG